MITDKCEQNECQCHHELTVEDVLSEMMQDAACRRYDDGSCRMGLTDEQFNKYAQMLQLRENGKVDE